MAESTPTYVTAATEPKSSIEASLGAASTPKGEPQISVKIYFDAAERGALELAVGQLTTTFEGLRRWAQEQRVPQ